MKIRSHKELEVYQIAFEAAMQIFKISKSFPKEERYSLTDQISDRQGRFVQIWLKLFANENIQTLLWRN